MSRNDRRTDQEGTIIDIINVWKETNKKIKNKKLEFTCNFCDKSFSSERTLMSHACETRRRFNQRNELGVRYGHESYRKFYDFFYRSTQRDYKDFCKSPYYIAFVKFGRYIESINAVNPEKFIEWMIRSGEKIEKWCSDKLYLQFLSNYIQVENPATSVERSIKHMQNWADDNNSVFNHYFLYAAPNKVCYDISVGKISPWIVYNSKSGLDFLSRVSDDQLSVIFEWINPEFWNKKFKENPIDVEWIKEVAIQAGL